MHISSSFTDFVLLLHEMKIIGVDNTVIDELFEIFALSTFASVEREGTRTLMRFEIARVRYVRALRGVAAAWSQVQEIHRTPVGLTSQDLFHGPQPGSGAVQEGSWGQPQTPSGTTVGMGASACGVGLAQQDQGRGRGPAAVELESQTPTASLGQRLVAPGRAEMGPWAVGQRWVRPQGRLDWATEGRYCPQCPDI